MPGEIVEAKDGTSQVVEMLLTGAEGTEVSTVSVPAVVGTGVDEIRAALAAVREELREKPKGKHMGEIAKALGLPADASEAQLVAELERREALLLAGKDAVERLTAELTAVNAQLSMVAERALDTRRSALLERAFAEGKCLRTGPLAERISALAAKDVELAEALIAELPRVTPVGLPPISTGADPTSHQGPTDSRVDEYVRRYAKQLAVTDDEIAAARQRLAAK
ncbi:MAG: hypothetical protein V2A73_19185 [Pseudomonadota bacterium]